MDPFIYRVSLRSSEETRNAVELQLLGVGDRSHGSPSCTEGSKMEMNQMQPWRDKEVDVICCV